MVVNVQIKVLDFGLAIAREHLSNNDATGTLYYMALNSSQGSCQYRLDLYAVGVISMNCSQNSSFDSTSNKYALMYKIVRTPPAITPDRQPFTDVIMRLLQKTPPIAMPTPRCNHGTLQRN